MSDPVLIALIANGAAVVTSIIISIGNRRRLIDVHKSTNGLKDQLVKSTRDSAYKEGVADQKETERKSK